MKLTMDDEDLAPGPTEPAAPAPAPDLSVLLIGLLKGVLYREADERQWSSLLQLQARVREYVAVLNLELVLDEAEGYAFLRGRPEPADDDPVPRLPRLAARYPELVLNLETRTRPFLFAETEFGEPVGNPCHVHRRARMRGQMRQYADTHAAPQQAQHGRQMLYLIEPGRRNALGCQRLIDLLAVGAGRTKRHHAPSLEVRPGYALALLKRVTGAEGDHVGIVNAVFSVKLG